MKLEHLIIASLVKREDYARKVLAFLIPEYFADNTERTVYEMVARYFQKYNVCPATAALRVETDALSINQKDHETVAELIDAIESVDVPKDLDWLVDSTEKWCKDRAVYNAIYNCIKIIDDTEEKQTDEDPYDKSIFKKSQEKFKQNFNDWE